MCIRQHATLPSAITFAISASYFKPQISLIKSAPDAIPARPVQKGIVVEEEVEKTCMSGIPSRPYCKGRNYDPNRYASNTTEE